MFLSFGFKTKKTAKKIKCYSNLRDIKSNSWAFNNRFSGIMYKILFKLHFI